MLVLLFPFLNFSLFFWMVCLLTLRIFRSFLFSTVSKFVRTLFLHPLLWLLLLLICGYFFLFVWIISTNILGKHSISIIQQAAVASVIVTRHSWNEKCICITARYYFFSALCLCDSKFCIYMQLWHCEMMRGEDAWREREQNRHFVPTKCMCQHILSTHSLSISQAHSLARTHVHSHSCLPSAFEFKQEMSIPVAFCMHWTISSLPMFVQLETICTDILR